MARSLLCCDKPPDKGMSPPTPGISYEYQKKGITEIAFRKSLILKGAILVGGLANP